MLHTNTFLIISLIFCFSQGAYARNPDIADEKVPAECKSLEEGKKKGCARFENFDSYCTNGELAYIKDSCLIDKSFIAIPELSPDTATINVTKEIINKYGANDIARNLIYRYYVKNELSGLSDDDFLKPYYSYYQWIDVQIAFHFNQLDNIVSSGFLNQHKTGASRGTLSHDMRLRVEKDMLDFDIADVFDAYDVLPKYSYAAPVKTQKEMRNFDYTSMYGNVFAVLNDDVRKRATFTQFDSLGYGYGETGKKATIHSLYWPLQSQIQPDPYHPYWETQVWGTIQLKDIKYFLVRCYLDDLADQYVKELNEKTHKPVYSCKRNQIDATHAHFTRNELLVGEGD